MGTRRCQCKFQYTQAHTIYFAQKGYTKVNNILDEHKSTAHTIRDKTIKNSQQTINDKYRVIRGAVKLYRVTRASRVIASSRLRFCYTRQLIARGGGASASGGGTTFLR